MLQREDMLRFGFILTAAVLSAAAPEAPGYRIAGGAAGGWAPMLQSLGLPERPEGEARVIVVPEGAAAQPWIGRADEGAVVILEGDSEAARSLGFVPGARKISVRSVRDARQPDLRIKWEKAAQTSVFAVPKEAKVLCRDRKTGAPLVAAVKRGRGAVLWVALAPGEDGYERFPFLPHALVDLGVRPPFASRRLWAFFDSAYRLHMDAEAVARQWRATGISALHVGAWDFIESQPERDEYLRNLIAACHRHGILVYAWLELPHVSDAFWKEHPEWREKTAKLKDAHVDWRLLMNLVNPDCHRAAAAAIRAMMLRFDWDGVNLGELYFDGISGVRNLSEFTPLNEDVRREFQQSHGFDPLELFQGRRDPKRLRQFLDYRVELSARLHEEWMDELEKIRQERPGLDLVVTYVDDRFDTHMRDNLGADAARVLQLLERHEATFIVEDPATLWGLGPGRYAEIARRYAPLTSHPEDLGVDINIVDRDHAYPTQKQVGAEVLELFHTAAASFSRVMFYYERSIDSTDAPLIPAAAAVVERCERRGDGLVVASPYGTGVRWEGRASVDGRPWPVQDGERVWLPPGEHLLAPAASTSVASVLDFNGTIENAASLEDGIELVYRSHARALATLDRKPVRLVLDGHEARLDLIGEVEGVWVLRLPSGKHTAVVTVE
jgi:hypothetical protein